MKRWIQKTFQNRLLENLTSLKYTELLVLWGIMTLLFGVGYFMFSSIGNVNIHGPEVLVNNPNLLNRFYDSLYYSIITATSTGYGDIVPRGLTKLLAAAQSMSALFVFAIFVTKLVAHRQEVALSEVHRLTFEDVFHNIREEFYIIRKDFDKIIDTVKENREVKNHEWEKLTIAYRQAKSLFTEIPDFYDDENKLYIIDPNREQLLQEAVHRTLHRINEMIDEFSIHNIAWMDHEDSMTAFYNLIEVVEKTTPVWEQKSPYQRAEAFQGIVHMKETMLDKIKETLPEG